MRPYLRDRLSFAGEGGVSILELGELQEVALDISVTNTGNFLNHHFDGFEKENSILIRCSIKTGESAYEASLYVSHPKTLNFIGRAASSESNAQLLCNSFNATMVACSLGNPFKTGTGYVKLRFDPSGVQDAETVLSFFLFTNTTSEELNPQGETVTAHVVKRAEISIKG